MSLLTASRVEAPLGLSILLLLALVTCEYTSDSHWLMYIPALSLVGAYLATCRLHGAGELRVTSPSVWAPVLSAGILAAISLCCSEAPYISLIEAQSFVMLFATFVIASGRSAGEGGLSLSVSACAMLPYAIQGFSQAWTQHVNAHGALHDSNLYAGYLTAGAAGLACHLLQGDFKANGRDSLVERASWGLFALLCAGAYVGHSRGAWLGLLSATPLVLVSTRHHTGMSRKRISLVVAVLAVLAATCVMPKTVRDAEQHDRYGQSTNSRLAMWQSTVQMVEDHPVTGVGFGLWHLYYPRYRTSQDSDSAGYRAHNDYLEALASGGPLGALAVATIPALWLLAVWRARRHRPRHVWAFVGASVGSGVLIVQAAVNFIFHEPAIVFFLGLSLGSMYAQLAETQTITASGKSRKALLGLSASFVTLYAAVMYLPMVPNLILANSSGFEARYLGALMAPRALSLLSLMNPLSADPVFTLAHERTLDGMVAKAPADRIKALDDALKYYGQVEQRQGPQAATDFRKAVVYLAMPGAGRSGRTVAEHLLESALTKNPAYYPAVKAYVNLRVEDGELPAGSEALGKAVNASPAYQRRSLLELKARIDRAINAVNERTLGTPKRLGQSASLLSTTHTR